MAESFLSINTLILALKGLEERNLLEDRDLYDETREVFRKLNLLSDFDEKDLGKVIGKLEALPPEIREKNIEDLLGNEEQKPESDLNQKTIEELVEAHEKAKNNREKERISHEIYLRTGQKDVALFLEKQKELAAQTLKTETEKTEPRKPLKLIKIQREQNEEVETRNQKLETRIEQKETKQAIKEAIKSEKFDEKALKKILEKDFGKQVTKEIIKEIKETRDQKLEARKLNEEIEKAVYSEEKSDLKKELDKKYGKKSEESERVLSQVNQVKAEIKVEAEAERIVENISKKLQTEPLLITKNSKEELKKAILESWEKNEKLVLPKEFKEVSEKTTTIRELSVAAESFKDDNLQTIVYFRAGKLEERVSRELRENGIRDEKLITEYTEVLNELYNDPGNLILETDTQESVRFVETTVPQSSLWQAEESVREAQFLAKNMVKAPKKFNVLVKRYNLIREKIGAEKLPKINEVRVTDKITSFLSRSPQALKMFNRIQSVTGAVGRLQAWRESLFLKGSEKAASFIAQKIGNQALASFIQNSAAVMAKEGTVKGIQLILKSVLSKGAVAAGEAATVGATTGGAAAGGGALAGAVAAFQALPVVGQVIAVVALAGVVVSKVIKTVKGVAEKLLGTKLNQIQKFLSEDLGLGKFVGKVGQFIFDVGAFLVGIPALFSFIKIGTALTPVVAIFFIGTFVYSMFQHQQISSIVPPDDLSGCILKRGDGPGGLPSDGKINCDQNAPENEIPGLRGGKENYFRIANQWWSGKSHAEECFNDVVNRSLCAGINPLYSLWAWAHESAASNYDHGNIQDFGINDSSIENNFDAQIKVFLNLDPASNCDLTDPKLSGPDGYWLAWASSYLTGQCDPDVGQKQTGNTGRNYFNDMKNKTWDWIASVPIPKDIYVEKGGQNCEQAGAPFSLTGPTKEIIGDDGQTYICSSGGGGGPSMISPGGAPVAGSITQCPFDSFSHGNSWAIDWGAGFGTPIYSTFSGIARLGEGNGYGFYVDVHSNYNGDDFFIRYAHMPPGGYTVGDGEAVAAGQQIGIVDNTGFSTGNHLHYEVVGANIDWDNAGPYFGLTQEEFNSACR